MNRHQRRAAEKTARHVQRAFHGKTTIICGPSGCGKSTNAERIAKAYGLRSIVDDWTGPLDKVQPGTLYLTNDPALMVRGPGVFRATTYDVAMEMVKIDEEPEGVVQ